MHVRMGNPSAREHGEPAVYSHAIDTGEGGHDITAGADVRDLALHLAQHPGPVTHLPGHEAFVAVTRTFAQHSDGPPSWVSVEPTEGEDPALMADFERQLTEFYEAPRGVPANVEQTHWTDDGSPPGVDSGRFAPTQEGS